MTERTYLCLGGPKDGETITVADGRMHFAVHDPAAWPTTVIAGDPSLYVVREVAMFGRYLRLAVLDTLTTAEMDDAAWRHLASPVAQDLGTKRA